MAKLTGKAKKDFLARMAKGRRNASKKNKPRRKSTKTVLKRFVKRQTKIEELRDMNKKELNEVLAMMRAIKNPAIKEIVIRK